MEGERAGAPGGVRRTAGRARTDRAGQPCAYRTVAHPTFDLYEDGYLLDFGNTRPSPDHELHELWCNADFVGLRWYGPGTPTPEVAAELERLLDRLDVAEAVLEVRPEGAGLVGVPAYAWLTEPVTGPLTASVTLPGFGTTVTVVATLAGVTWDFGDGSPPLDAGPGRPWPEPSPVRHAYAEPSAPGAPYVVTATLTYRPTYTVDGVPGGPLEPITFTLGRDYGVRELQAVRNR
ncbi:MAG: hypothetical protein AB7H43_08760 [Acidimicrobiia bacterium]